MHAVERRAQHAQGAVERAPRRRHRRRGAHERLRHGRAGLHRRRVRDASRSRNMTTLVDMGLRYGVPTMGVTAVGKELTRDARYLGLATRICAELGRAGRQDLLLRRGLRARHAPAARCRS
ncbi:MAG: hypothetical protein MZU84_04780 [Sphingobacterium sp.]|nr:hypothetical protein [Sphingobacterium sp.]